MHGNNNNLNIYLCTLIPQLTNAANTADTRWLEARDLSEGEGLSGGQRSSAGRRMLRLAYSFSRQALAKPCRRRTLRLGRRPTVQRQSTGTALPPSVRHQTPYVLLDTHISLSLFLYLIRSVSLSLCLSVSISISVSDSPSHRLSLTHRKGGETETVKTAEVQGRGIGD